MHASRVQSKPGQTHKTKGVCSTPDARQWRLIPVSLMVNQICNKTERTTRPRTGPGRPVRAPNGSSPRTSLLRLDRATDETTGV